MRVLTRAGRGGSMRPMSDEITIPVAGVPESCFRSIDRAIAAVAERQHGVIALHQLVELGLSERAVRLRVATGRLHRIHRGVYAVGHASLSARGRWMSAVLACGAGAVLSHRSAAALNHLRPSSSPSIEVVVPRRRSSSPKGIVVRCRSNLTPPDATVVDRIPCTSVAQTLLDLAALLSDDDLERACDRAEQLRLFDLGTLEDVLARTPCARGAGRLRRVLAGLAPRGALTRSEIERLFLALCRDFGLPMPLVNGWIQLDGFGFEPDFLWPKQRLIVETDGGAVHRTRRAFEDDRRRDQLLAVAGYRTLRFTWRQVTDEPERVAFTIKTVLDLFGYPHVP
jgi:Protein of unknown function (DUF559)/Transcriptional regulator, AbiEi antitoxin